MPSVRREAYPPGCSAGLERSGRARDPARGQDLTTAVNTEQAHRLAAAPTKRPPSTPIGTSGTRNYQGLIVPDDLTRDFAGPSLYPTVDRMVRTDPVVRAALMMVCLPIVEATVTVVPAGPEPEDHEVAELVRRALLEHLDWRRIIWQAIPARYGHAVLEEVWEAVEWELSVPAEDGTQDVQPKRLYWVPAGYQPRLGRTIFRWNVDQAGRLVSITQRRLDPITAEQRDVDIPADRLLVVVNEQEGDDYTGVSVLRSAYRAWYTKEKLEVIDAMAKERGGVGIPVGKVPAERWETDADEMSGKLMALRAGEDAFLVLRKGTEAEEGEEVEMLDLRSSSQADCLPSLHYHAAQILWAVMGAWQYLGQGEVGAKATAAVQQDPFYLGVTALAQTVVEAFNRQVVPRIVAFNYGTDRVPCLEIGDIKPADVGPVVDGVARLVTAGAIETDEGLEAALRSLLGLPEKAMSEDDPEADEPAAPPAPPEPPADPAADAEDPTAEDAPDAGPDAPTSGDPAAPAPADVRASAAPGSRTLTDSPARWRQPTPLEAFVALDAIDATVEEQRQRYQTLCQDQALRVAEQLAGQTANVAPDQDVTRPTDLEGILADRIAAVLSDVAAFGRTTVRHEVAGQRRRPPASLADDPPRNPDRLQGWLTRRAKASARAVVGRLMAAADRLSTRESRATRDVAQVRLEAAAKTALRAEAVATVSQALSAGRRAETEDMLASGQAGTAVYSAVLDQGTCEPCMRLDGQEYEIGSDDYEADYPPLADCEGREACRCLMVVVSAEEVPSDR